MKRIFEDINLSNQIEEITMMDLRKKAGEIMTAVSLGKTYIIKRMNTPISMLIHIPKDILRMPGDNLSIIIDSKGKISYKANKVYLIPTQPKKEK